MTVQDLMTRDVESCTPGANLAEAAMIMWRRDCGFVPVVENPGGRFIGVITDRDICMAAATKHSTPDSLTVGAVMGRRVSTCNPSEDARVAMQRMSEARVRRLPVVDKENRLAGVLALNDLALAAERTARRGEEPVTYEDVMGVLRAVSEHRLPARMAAAS